MLLCFWFAAGESGKVRWKKEVVGKRTVIEGSKGGEKRKNSLALPTSPRFLSSLFSSLSLRQT